MMEHGIKDLGLISSSGSWETMTDKARAELWDFHDYLESGGKRVHGSYGEWRYGEQRKSRRRAPGGGE